MSNNKDAKQASQMLQDPMVATVVSAGLTAIGIPASPEQVMQAAQLAEAGLNMQESMNKKNSQENENKGPSNSM